MTLQPRLDLGDIDVSDDPQDSDEWFTPAWLIEAVHRVLGEIDLDPASCEEANSVVKAKDFFTKQDDGLAQLWKGRIFLNPPYSNPTPWITHFFEQIVVGDVWEAIVLTSNSTENRWAQMLLDNCNALCFPKNRLHHWNPAKKSDSPRNGSMVTYFGPNPRALLFKKVFRDHGFTMIGL